MALLGQKLRRSIVLTLAVLACGAANDAGLEFGDRVSDVTPEGAFGAFLTGRYAAQRSDLDTAADKLEAALTHEPGIPELATQAFIAATLAGRPAASRLAASLPDNPVAQLVLGDRDAKAGNWDGAEARFAALPQQGLTQVLRPLLLAWVQQGAGRTEAALATVAPQLEGQRARAVYALHAGLIAELAGRTGQAAAFYRSAQADYGGLNLRLGTILASFQARFGSVADAQATVRDLTGANGDLAMARADMEASLPDPAVRNAADGIAEAYLALAATLRQQNAADSAQVLLRLALDMRPDFTAARLLLSDIQDTGRRKELALATLAPVPAADPLIAVVRLRQAALLDAASKSDEAAQILDELARQHPDRPEPLALSGDILRRKNRFAEAASAYSGAIARLGAPTRANWPIFYQRGIAYERAGQWPAAEADFETALQLAPEQPSVLNYLGYAWTERGMNLQQARGMIERAVQQRPDDGSIVDSLGWVLLQQGDAPGALKQLERAVELQPEDSVINGHLGDALAAVGRQREAEFQWRRALILKPEPEDAKRLTAKLDALPGATPAPTPAPSTP